MIDIIVIINSSLELTFKSKQTFTHIVREYFEMLQTLIGKPPICTLEC